MTIKDLQSVSFKQVHFPAIQIVYGQMMDELSQTLSKDDLDEYLTLYQMALEDPKKTRASAEKFLQKHPTLSSTYNLLSYIYIRLKKVRRGNLLIEENYKHNPQNLFAKINYADLCLRIGKIEKIPSIFDDKLNLKELYPKRKNFHFSEILGFYTVLGFYFLRKGEKLKAMDYCSYTLMIDPEDKSARYLAKKIVQKSFLTPLLNRLKKQTNPYR